MGRIIPYIMENKKNVWGHQPDWLFFTHVSPLFGEHKNNCLMKPGFTLFPIMPYGTMDPNMRRYLAT